MEVTQKQFARKKPDQLVYLEHLRYRIVVRAQFCLGAQGLDAESGPQYLA